MTIARKTTKPICQTPEPMRAMMSSPMRTPAMVPAPISRERLTRRPGTGARAMMAEMGAKKGFVPGKIRVAAHHAREAAMAACVMGMMLW